MSESDGWYDRFLWQQSGGQETDRNAAQEKPADEAPVAEETEQKRFRCRDVLVRYIPTPCKLVGKKLRKTMERLERGGQGDRDRGSRILNVLLGSRYQMQRKPVPAREVWASGLTFLSKEELKAGQNMVLSMTFAAHTRLPTCVYAQGRVSDCGPGKGHYPWKVRLEFTELTREAIGVLKDPSRYLPKG